LANLQRLVIFFIGIKYSREEHLLSPIRILVADDYEGWRRQACLLLQVRPEFQIICEASDGSEAVQKAKELKPDLILLDIGLPTLNGLDAARQIRQLSRSSKILFLSQESSADVVQECFSLGAQGYVVKARAGTELLAAVEAVLQGRQFVGSGLSSHHFTDATEAQVPDYLCKNEDLRSIIQRKAEINRSHEVQFYSDDEAFVVGFAHFIEAALKTGNAVIVAATESHGKSLLQRLQEHGVDIAAAIEQGRYLPLDMADTLSTFMVKDLPDPVRFFRVVGDLIAAAAQATAGKYSRVAICGECASILWAQGNADAAIQVEQFCNQLTKRYKMDILCGFSLSSFYREEDKQIFEKICRE
jgi:DNA-binding NarL/FixJ family response regulator